MKQNKEDETLLAEEVDLKEVSIAMEKIQQAKQAKLNSMTPKQLAEEKKRQEDLDKMNKLTQQIEQERIKLELEMSQLTHEEQILAYQKINEDAEKYAKNLGVKSTQISKPHTDKKIK